MKTSVNSVSRWQVERICLRIFGQLLHRHLRYLLVVLPMYLRSLYGPARCHMLRACYSYARYLDDVLDGDIAVDEPKREYITHIVEQAKNGKSANTSPYILLGQYVYQHVDAYASNGMNLSQELDLLIQAMLFDRERADEHLLLSRLRLDRHHRITFMSALNVTLNVTGARYEPANIKSLARAQGSLYTLRDLKGDLDEGINNIPHEILKQSGIPAKQFWTFEILRKDPVIREWIGDEYHRGLCQLTQTRRMLENNRDFYFRVTVKPLYRGLNYLSHKLCSQYDCL